MQLTTPFKSPEQFEKELQSFANKHKTFIETQARRISDYFEISCYHKVVEYYESMGFRCEACNLKSGSFRYKCSPTGHLGNFSYFAIRSGDEEDETLFYIFHNATVQSKHNVHVFTTPDIVISKTKDAAATTDYYETRKKLTYIPNDQLISFCEAKHLKPFPELMIGFVGTVNELLPQCLAEIPDYSMNAHLAPSLLMSGCFNKSTGRIRVSLEERYNLNMFDNAIDPIFSIRYRELRGEEPVKRL